MAQFVYTMHRVGKVVPPKRHILKNISLSFFPGAKIGVLGLNGAGKSTLLRIMAGIDKDIEGEARPQPDIKIGYLPQEPQLNPEHTVRESIEEAVSEVVNALKRLDEVYALYADPDADFDKLAAEQGRLEEIIQAHDGHNLNVQLERAADALRLPDWDAKIANLSGGERRRVALCRLLLEKPDMLLLDEPTNHLDAESVAWLERFLHDFEGTVVAITHDRYFLDNVAGWILELDRGEGIPWEGNYSSWLEQKDQRLAQEASQEAARRKSIEKELEWVRQGTKGRQSKGKARLARFAVVCIWRSCCRLAATCCCSTNQPTTWISKPCARWKTPCWSSRAARWLSRTTVGSSTVSPRTFWITRMKVKLSSSKVTLPSTKSTRNARWAQTRWSRSVSSTSVLRSNA